MQISIVRASVKDSPLGVGGEMRSVITGQRVSAEKKQRAREMREAMTPAEAALWEHLRLDKLGVHFRRQQIIEFPCIYLCRSTT